MANPMVHSTAGAIPVFNEKGEMSMKKVKVQRYIPGKRPEYAPDVSSEEESEEEDFIGRGGKPPAPVVPSSPPRARRDTRWDRGQSDEEEDTYVVQRQMQQQSLQDQRPEEVGDEGSEAESDIEVDRSRRRRYVHEPEVLDDGVIDEIDELASDEDDTAEQRQRFYVDGKEAESEPDEEDEADEDDIAARRAVLRQRALQKKAGEEEVLAKEEDIDFGRVSDGEVISEEESEAYSESEDEEIDTGPRLKPVFVRKRDRVTIQEKEKEATKQKQLEAETKKMTEERRKQTLRMVEDEIRKEISGGAKKEVEGNIADVNTDDENEELAYEVWKLRELKRIKRHREEKEQLDKEKAEVERLRTMNEDERRAALRNNPHVVTNKALKGKYKFLQKYYHRGAFFLDREDELFKRDYSFATLEDHFDKASLPKVMQVKNFGRSGRTKYTHLVDQDTTEYDSAWVSETAANLKFHNSQAGGAKQIFEKPTVIAKRRKM